MIECFKVLGQQEALYDLDRDSRQKRGEYCADQIADIGLGTWVVEIGEGLEGLECL